MYFFSQIYRSFSLCLCSYAGNPAEVGDKGPEQVAIKPKGLEDQKTEIRDLADSSEGLNKKMSEKGKQFAQVGEQLRGNNAGSERENGVENKKEIQAVTTKEVLANVQPKTSEEMKIMKQFDPRGENPEKAQEAIYKARLEKISSNEVSDGEKKLIESEFIAKISEKSGVDPKLMSDMRALGFAGLQDGNPQDVANKLREFSGDMEKVNQFAKNNGINLPQTKEEFISLYNHLKGPDGIIRVPATEKERNDAGIHIDSSGNIEISGPGYSGGERQAGRPYAKGGEIYSGQRSSVSPRNYPVDPNLDINNLPKGVEGLMDLIVLKEARGSYDTVLDASNIQPPKPLTTMTCLEVYAFQKEMIAEQRARGIEPPSSACGGLQVVSGTLKGLIDSNPSLNWGDTFDKNTQRKMMLALLQEDGLDAYKSGSLGKQKFMENISGTWASFPKDMSGAGSYDGYAGNKAYVNPNVVHTLLDQIKEV